MSLKIEELLQKKPYLKLYLDKETEINPFQLVKIPQKEEFYIQVENKKLASSIAPKKAAERLVASLTNYEKQIVVVLGLGNPHLILEINSKLKDNQILLVIDKNEELFFLLFEEFLLPVLEFAGRHLFLGEDKLNLLWNYLESLPIEKISGIKFLKNQPSIDLDSEFYIEIEEKIRKVFSSKMSDLLTKFEFDRIWAKNSFSNLLSYNDSSLPKYKFHTLINQFSNIPAILVSAGPSLRSQCEFIKKYRDKVFVFSCDTSLKVLLKFGIIPDGVMTLDAQMHSYFHFLGEDLKKIPLFADFVTAPSLLRNFQFQSIIFSMTGKYQIDSSGKSFVERTAGGKTINETIGNIGDVQSGGSVATSAFDVLRQMNFSPIYLMGQDLAYTGREIHSTGTHHNEKWLRLIDRKKSLEKINEEIVRKRETVYVPSCDDKEVLSDFILCLYKSWFEESMKQSFVEAYNINDTGAKIENMENYSLLEADEIFQKYEIHNYPWRDLEPWKENKINHSEKIDQDFFVLILNQLETEMKTIQANKENFTLEEIQFELEKFSLINEMIRKTKIYILRNDKNLTEIKKKEILLESILNEIRYIKRSIFSLL